MTLKIVYLEIFSWLVAKSNVSVSPAFQKTFIYSHFKTTLENDYFTLAKNVRTRILILSFLKFNC